MTDRDLMTVLYCFLQVSWGQKEQHRSWTTFQILFFILFIFLGLYQPPSVTATEICCQR